MAIKKWKAIYFPGDLKGVEEASKDAMLAANHSLNKWRGLSPEILSEYKLSRRSECILQNGSVVFEVDEAECALCAYDDLNTMSGSCNVCPLRHVSEITCAEDNSPYQYWINTGDNGPMVDALEKTVEFLEKGGV